MTSRNPGLKCFTCKKPLDMPVYSPCGCCPLSCISCRYKKSKEALENYPQYCLIQSIRDAQIRQLSENLPVAEDLATNLNKLKAQFLTLQNGLADASTSIKEHCNRLRDEVKFEIEETHLLITAHLKKEKDEMFKEIRRLEIESLAHFGSKREPNNQENIAVTINKFIDEKRRFIDKWNGYLAQS